MKAKYDLEERLLVFSANVIRLTEELPNTRAGNHIANQLLRSGTSPYPNHGEAQAAESTRDFLHKLRICLKELREANRWIRLIRLALPVRNPDLSVQLFQESDELIRIFVASIKTAERKNNK